MQGTVNNTRTILILLLFVLSAMDVSGVAAADRGVTVAGKDNLPPKTWGTYHALVIGINDYQYWPRLQTAEKDARVMRDVLVAKYGFQDAHVTLRLNEDASRRQIIRDLRRIATSMEDNDNLLIYYAGHGQLDEFTGDGYWIPAEGEMKDPGTWLANSFIKSLLSSERLLAKNVIIIADSCYSGSMLRGGPSLLQMEGKGYRNKLAKAASKRSRQVISSGGVEPVADGGADGHSLFAYYLIKALRDNDREVIDLENLFHTRVWKPVTEIGDQRPNVGRLKTPMDDDGQFVLYNQGWVESQQQRRAQQAAATQQKRQAEEADRMAAIQAERQKLELERQQLKMEQELATQKQQLEMERMRMKLEKQQQELEYAKLEARMKQIEAERTLQEQNASKSVTMAAVSPKTRAAQPLPDGSLRIALLPLHTTVRKSWHGSSTKKFQAGIVTGILEGLNRTQNAHLAYSYRPFPELFAEFSVSPVTGDPPFDKDLDALWKKPSFMGTLEPKKDAAIQYGKRIGADVVILVRGENDRNFKDVALFAIDTRDGKSYREGGNISAKQTKGEVKRMIRSVMENIPK